MIYGSETIAGSKILIADDVETNRLVLEAIIQEMGCVPILAENGQQALELTRKHKPHLILTDISMPGMNGYELCRTLKGKEETRNIPVIFISAFDEAENIVEGFSIGGADYITKPFIPAEVQVRVGVHLRLHVANRELKEMNRKLQVSVTEQLKQMEQEKKNILYALANIAAQNANYEKERMERLRKNCRILAQGMQLSPLFEGEISDTYIDTIELSAPLCDIGNLGIPMELLRKKEGLTEEEEQIVRNHTKIGAKLLNDLHVNNDYNDFISTSKDIAYYHHENFDGSGYPEGLKEEQIPIAAQIVALMDRYCGLTEKNQCSREEALEVLGRESGTKYNPRIYEICRKIARQLC